MTPGAEFNTYADSVASARVFALTSPNPETTMPPTLKGHKKEQLPSYPEKLSRQLKLKLFSLGTHSPRSITRKTNAAADITTPHKLTETFFKSYVASPALTESPLAQWATHFLSSTYNKIHSLNPSNDRAHLGLEMHDPLTVWYALSAADPKWAFTTGEDIRVETAGQWTRGCCIVERRPRTVKERTEDLSEEVVGDAGGWGDSRRGNRLERCIGTPGEEAFAPELLSRIFGEDVGN